MCFSNVHLLEPKVTSKHMALRSSGESRGKKCQSILLTQAGQDTVNNANYYDIREGGLVALTAPLHSHHFFEDNFATSDCGGGLHVGAGAVR